MASVDDDQLWAGSPFGWDHDDRLIDPTIDFPATMHHGPTGTMAVNWILRGAWSDVAINALRTCLAATLPGRYHAQVIDLGTIQVLVCLGAMPGNGGRGAAIDPDLRDWRDDGDVEATLTRADRAFDLMVGRRGPAALPPLPVPQPLTRRAFAAAQADAAGREYVRTADFADPGYERATWAKLRQATRYDLDERVYTYRSRL